MQRKFLDIIIYVIIAFLNRSSAYTEGPGREENSLIPKALRPIDYNLLFEMSMASKEYFFVGSAVIRLECVERTTEIILNMKDLSIDEDGLQVAKEVSDSNIQPINTSEPALKAEKQWLIITLKEELEVNEIIQIKLKYTKLADTPQDPDVAFLKYSYSRKTGEMPKWLAVSKPGAVNGRRLFPCIDEPGVKTEIRMRITCDEDMISVSNTRILEDQIHWNTAEDSGIVHEPYYNAPFLPTFSIGFVVGDLKRRSHFDEFIGIEIRIWSDPAVLEQLDFAGETAVKIVKFYREYFYSIHAAPKMNVVALPFYGNTEKWIYGLVILEESLITNENPSTPVREIETAFTLCDVFCHQYFGPLTTFKTWSENWLFMGLALFYRIPCMENILPTKETGVVNSHLVESFIRVSSVNAEIKSRPVMVPDSRVDLTNLFRDTTLAETAYFLVRMMSYFLGEAELSEQVKNYIAELTFRVSSLDELWAMFPLGEKNNELLSEDVTVKAIMDSWTQKEGLAYVKMTRNKKEKSVKIQQELAAGSDRASYRIIPLNFLTKSESKEKSATKRRATKKSEREYKPAEQLARESETMKKSTGEAVQYWLHSEPIIMPVDKYDWIILGTRLNVLCRVEYDPITLKLLRKTLMNRNSYDMIDVMSRTKLISDLFTSAEMGKLSHSILLKFMRYLKHEKSHFPIVVALHEFNRIRIGLFGTEIFFKFQGYVQEILKAIIRRNKFNIKDISEDDYEQYYLKKLIFTSACTFQIKECVDLSKAHFAKLLENGNLSRKTDQITGALREPLYCQAIREGDDQEWSFLFLFYRSEHWESLNDIILKALACTTDSEKIRIYLEQTLDPEKIGPEATITVYQNVASNGNGYSAMKSFFRDKAEEILQLNKNNPSRVHRYLGILYENTWKQEDFTELEGFIAFNVPLHNAETYLIDSKKIAQKNISWLKNMKVEISEFFEGRKIGNRIKKALSPRALSEFQKKTLVTK